MDTKVRHTREIKFRAWDKLTSEMSPEFSLFGEFTLMGAVHAWQHEESILHGFKFDATDTTDSLGRLNDLVIMQFTGLHDKNGNEIYEGDILNGIKGFHWLVEWNDNHACYQVRSAHVIAEVINNENAEVIGNIYEHPNLLSQ